MLNKEKLVFCFKKNITYIRLQEELYFIKYKDFKKNSLLFLLKDSTLLTCTSCGKKGNLDKENICVKMNIPIYYDCPSCSTLILENELTTLRVSNYN